LTSLADIPSKMTKILFQTFFEIYNIKDNHNISKNIYNFK